MSEDSLVCPICETQNPSDAIHCEVCGERLVGESAASADSAEHLSSDGAAVVGFAVEDSEEVDGEPIQFGASGEELPEESEAEIADGIDEQPADETDEAITAAPADETASIDVADVESSEGDLDEETGFDAEEPDVDDVDEVVEGAPSEADEAVSEADEAVSEADEAVSEADEVDEAAVSEADEVAEVDEAAASEADEVDEDAASAPADDPEFLYSPMDGAAYPRGSAEYEEGFGPDGEELVAHAPDLGDEGTDLADLDVAEAGLSEASGASMGDAELAAAAAPGRETSEEFKQAFKVREKQRASMAPLPEPGQFAEPAVLTVYSNRQPVMRLAVDMDEVLIGRRDPVADAYPDVDLTDLDADGHISRKHAYIYRQNKNYTLYAVSNAGTQLNADLLDLGDRRPLSDGDVIVLAGKIAMKFELPNG